MPANSAAHQILPMDPNNPQHGQMSTLSFTPTQGPQREMQKNYVFVDEHNRHKRLKVMRACEGCRRRKIKCDAATTNTWPCSACIRLKLHCVRPNGFDGAADSSGYETMIAADQFQTMTMPMQQNQMMAKSLDDNFGSMPGFPDGSTSVFHAVPYDVAQSQQDLHYTTVPPNLADNPYAQANAFPTPPLHHGNRQDSSPEAHSVDSYQQQDLADLLGTLKLNELGTAPYLRNKASFRRGEQPEPIEDDDDFESLPPIVVGRGSKIRIPPELMPDEETAMQYFELYFTHMHPFVPVLYKPHFYQQWRTARETIPPLILEAMFAIGGRLADEPAMGNQWLALASRHADNFMDVPRLSTLQALLMILKAREGAPKRGYFWRSWMTVVQCVQMAKDLGLDEHYEDHQVGRGCDFNPTDCHLRTRIWQTVYVCEVMVGTPQGRHDLSVDMDSVDFAVPPPIPGGDKEEYSVSRNWTYFARTVRNIGRMSKAYARLRKRKDWGIDPEFQQLQHSFKSFVNELPADLTISFPSDNSPPWLSSNFLGSLHSYHQLTVILFNRPPLSFLDPNANSVEWKKRMVDSYNAAKAVCRLQEAIMNQYGISGLACIQRGYSFPLYAGLSCIVIHLVAIVSPDPDLNTDAREFFTRHMRIVEQVMEAWPMPELQQQVNNVREAFSADTKKSFVLKPSFPYGSPQQSSMPSPPNASQGYRQFATRTGSLDQQLDAHHAPHVRYPTQPITPPISTGPMGSKNDSPAMQSLDVIPQGGQVQGMQQGMGMADQTGWNPSRIFEQWNNTFSVTQPTSLNMGHSPEGSENLGLSDVQSVTNSLPPTTQHISPQMYTATTNFVTPAMWQESVASVYEGGLKRAWDYDSLSGLKTE